DVVVDPVGAWWGLRSSRDGKSEGLAIPIFGGYRGDVPLEPTAGKLIADVVVDERLSCVLDVSAFDSEGAKRRFLADFAERLFRRKGQPGNEDPLHLFLEEADDYAPQRGGGVEINRTLGAFQRIVKQGRARGLGSTMITQRSAVLNKDLLTQIETLVVLRTTSPQDRKAIEGWVTYHGLAEEILASLHELKDGEAWIWSPWLSLVERIRFPRRRTFDSGSTPAGAGRRPSCRTSRRRRPLRDRDADEGDTRAREEGGPARAPAPRRRAREGAEGASPG
ncbi:MAG: ATP-binding protein, partial [Actinomycetota bacterium]